MEILFSVSLFLLLYTYALFPLCMLLVARYKKANWKKGEVKPSVTILVSVYNEEEIIDEKIRNSLAVDYDEGLLEIMVVSDGSSDRTEELVLGFNDSGVVLQSYPGRVGKTECLNRAVPNARGEVVLFTDANSMFPPDILKHLVSNFADPDIGLVTGWTRYRTAATDKDSTGLYAKLETSTKEGESHFSSCVGADGAVFAIRRDLFRPLSACDINDFVIPLNVIEQQKRVVLDRQVYCLENASGEVAKEFKRQVRITTRTLGALWRGRRFFNPRQYRSFAFFLLSHKLVRFLAPCFFIACLFSSLWLFRDNPVFAVFLFGQLAFVAVGVGGFLGLLEHRAVSLCTFFLLTISAQMLGWFRFLSGKSDTVWTPQR
jgi:cellulose synthase/poly-beta-1,6-N-acetylglucosamine synthase-like glycosyltransferase